MPLWAVLLHVGLIRVTQTNPSPAEGTSMRIVVLVKHVPDAASDRRFTEDMTTDRAGVDGLLSELDEYAVEQALQIAERAGGGEITYLTMGPATAIEALRKALSMGGDSGVHLLDDGLHGSDAIATSSVLAAALRRLEWDLIVTGMSSTDAAMSVIPAMVSERLGIPALTLAADISVEGDTVTIRRDTDDASMTVTASLPALASVTDQTGEARYPSFKGIMAAKKKPVTTWGLLDLDIDPAEVGLNGSWVTVQTATRRPPRSAGLVVTDGGAGGIQLAEFLAENKFV